jgi:hypothetical protein
MTKKQKKKVLINILKFFAGVLMAIGGMWVIGKAWHGIVYSVETVKMIRETSHDLRMFGESTNFDLDRVQDVAYLNERNVAYICKNLAWCSIDDKGLIWFE